MSNVLINDSFIDANIICIKDTFENVRFKNDNTVEVGAGLSVNRFINLCMKKEISSIEQMYCIPGTIGGALSMNAGVPTFEIFDVVQNITCVNQNGETIIFNKNELKPKYRDGNLPKDLIIISCTLQTFESSSISIKNTLKKIKKQRMSTQPIISQTCGSIFKNPETFKAWQLIDSAGCRSLSVGDAFVSDLHCNFIINKGNASFDDVVSLINLIKKQVFEKHAILLQEEVQIIE
jgi:UDP-N-acetylmuramate dehydrogenase